MHFNEGWGREIYLILMWDEDNSKNIPRMGGHRSDDGCSSGERSPEQGASKSLSWFILGQMTEFYRSFQSLRIQYYYIFILTVSQKLLGEVMKPGCFCRHETLQNLRHHYSNCQYHHQIRDVKECWSIEGNKNCQK